MYAKISIYNDNNVPLGTYLMYPSQVSVEDIVTKYSFNCEFVTLNEEIENSLGFKTENKKER